MVDNSPLPVPDNIYDVATAAGAFLENHLPQGCIPVSGALNNKLEEFMLSYPISSRYSMGVKRLYNSGFTGLTGVPLCA